MTHDNGITYDVIRSPRSTADIIIERDGSRNTTSKDRLTVGLAATNVYLFDSAGQRLK